MADPLRVLIVDDETPARNRLRDLLSDCNETLPLTLAGEAGNGVQALEWLNQHGADADFEGRLARPPAGMAKPLEEQRIDAPQRGGVGREWAGHDRPR